MTPASPGTQHAGAAHRAATRALVGFRSVPREVREDLAQEAALRTWQAPAIRHPDRFASLVARRLAIDWLRRRLDVDVANACDVAEVAPWQRQVEARLTVRAVLATIAGAPRLHRETLQLLFLDEHDIDEVLLAAGVDEDARGRMRDALYKRRSRATAWLRSRLPDT